MGRERRKFADLRGNDGWLCKPPAKVERARIGKAFMG